MNNNLYEQFINNYWCYLNGNPVENIKSFNEHGILKNELYENVFFKTNFDVGFPILTKINYFKYNDVDYFDTTLSFIIILPQWNNKIIAHELFNCQKNGLINNQIFATEIIKKLFKKHIFQFMDYKNIKYFFSTPTASIHKNFNKIGSSLNKDVINYFQAIGYKEGIKKIEKLSLQKYYE